MYDQTQDHERITRNEWFFIWFLIYGALAFFTAVMV